MLRNTEKPVPDPFLTHRIDITQRRSSWAGCRRRPKGTRITTKTEHHTGKKFLGRMLQNIEKYENHHEKWTSHRKEVLRPDVAGHRKVRVLPRKIDVIEKKFLGRMSQNTEKNENYHKNRHQFLGRMWQNTQKHENCHEKRTSKKLKRAKKAKKVHLLLWKLVPEHPRAMKSTRVTTKNEHRRSWRGEKVRELPRETRFRPFQDHRRTQKSTRITRENEHRRSWRAETYANSHAKPVHADSGQAETTKIHIQTNMQARKYENSEEFHLLLTFYHYRKNPKC